MRRRLGSAAALAIAMLAAVEARADETLVVETTCGAVGKVLIDGKDVGAIPAPVRVPIGLRRVKVGFDNGDSIERITYVNEGRNAIVMPSPRAYCLPRHREGARFGVYVGQGLSVVAGFTHPGVSPRAGVLLNFGISRKLDLRVRAEFQYDDSSNTDAWIHGNIPVELRFNLGSVFTLGVGLSAGFWTHKNTGGTGYSDFGPGFAAGLRTVLAGFRFGSRGQFEIDAFQVDYQLRVGNVARVDLYSSSSAVDNSPIHAFRFGAALAYLFLPDAPQKP